MACAPGVSGQGGPEVRRARLQDLVNVLLKVEAEDAVRLVQHQVL